MRRVISLVTVFVLCFALAVPAYASSVSFVPSITAKPAPEVVVGDTTVKVDGTADSTGDEQTDVPVIEVKNETDEVVYTAPVVDLVVTAVSQVHAEDTTVAISEEAANNLKEAYNQLNDQDFKFSEEAPELVAQVEEQLLVDVIEQVTRMMEEQGAEQEAIEEAIAAAIEVITSDVAALMDASVVTAMFDVSIVSEELEEYLNVEGHTVDVTFKADVPENHAVVVMVYKNDQWQTIEDVVVNGDGTITCTFAHFCPVAILTVPLTSVVSEEVIAPATEAAAPEAAPEAPAATAQPAEEGGFAWWWIVLVAAVAVVVVIMKGKGAKK